MGEIIEVVVELEVPEFFRTMDQVSGLASISSLLDAFTDLASLGLPDLDVSPEDLRQMTEIRQAMPAVESMSEAVAEAPIPVLMHLVDAPKYTLLVMLDRQSLTIAASELDGEARALIKLDRHVVKGKPEQVPFVPGVPHQSRAQRRAAGNKDGSKTLTLRSPAARATCIAIYR